MKFRYTLVLGLILLGLMAFVYFIEAPSYRKQQEAEETKDKLFSFEEDSIQALTISPKDSDQITFQRSNGTWLITAPITATADEFSVDAITTAIVDLEEKRKLEPGSNADQYGLADPPFVLTVKRKEAEDLILRFGEKSPLGATCYLQFAAENAVYLVNDRLLNTIDKSLFAFRQKKLLNYDTFDLTHLQIQGTRGDFTFKKDNKWNLTAPIIFPARDSEVRKIARELSNVKAKEFVVENAENLSDYGLDPPLYRIIATEDGEVASFSALIGKKDDVAYAKNTFEDPVMKIDASILETLDAGLDDLRESKLTGLMRWELKTVGLETQTASIQLTNNDDADWELVDDPAFHVEQDAVSEWLDKVLELEATGFIDGEINLGAYNLDPPAFTITLRTDDAEEILRSGIRDDKAYFQKEGVASLYELSSEAFEGLQITLDDLRQAEEEPGDELGAEQSPEPAEIPEDPPTTLPDDPSSDEGDG